MKNNACLPNIEPYTAAGINPKTKLPYKYDNLASARKEGIKIQLRILDEQDAVNRYRWYNLPCNLSSQEVERLLYYRGQLCFFYLPETEQFIFAPYALDGTIDFYGRYNTVHPVPFAEGVDKETEKRQSALLAMKKLDVIYGIPDDEEKLIDWQEKFISGKACVLVHDYTKQLSQTTISRQVINDPILDIMADCIPFLRTCLLSNTGVKGMRLSNEADYPNILDANMAFEKAALEGKPYIPIVGSVDFQELTGQSALKAEEYLLAMQGIDNYRLSLYGLDNGGLFQKKSHMLEAEQTMNAGKASIPLNDGLCIRQYFCDILNALTGLGVSCEISESILYTDMNMDGMSVDDNDQSGYSGEQPDISGGEV
jgi:hypothetical protein